MLIRATVQAARTVSHDSFKEIINAMITENAVIIGDFIYSHVNISYVCNLKTKYLFTINDILEYSLSVKIFLTSPQHSKPNMLNTKRPEVFYKHM